VLSFLLGPVLALFPKRWRNSLSSVLSVAWRPATVLSGFLESVIALIGLLYWYSRYMTTLVDHGVDSAISGKMPAGVTDHEIGFAALVIWATHPLTWLLAYGGVEGVVRLLAAAIADTCMGILPLFLLDKVFARLTWRGERQTVAARNGTQGNISSYLEAIGEKILVAGLPLVPDEICSMRNEPDEIMEIRACRRKEDWIPPRVVRYQNEFYRLEGCSRGTSSRPFHYTLRRLSAGVPGRNVLLYSPEAPVLRSKT
jgi:hypothetical protein